MKFELELCGYDKMPYSTEAIAHALSRAFGGIWKAKELPSTPTGYDLGDQVSDFVQSIKDKAGG